MNTNTRRQFFRTASGLLTLPALPALVCAAEAPALTKPKIVPPGEGKTIWAMGIHVTVRVTSEDTNGAYSVFEDVVPPGGGPPLHVHSHEDETMFVLEGELEAVLGDQTATVKPGTFIHMARGTCGIAAKVAQDAGAEVRAANVPDVQREILKRGGVILYEPQH